MSYEATIKVGRATTINIEADDAVWMFHHIPTGHVTTCMSASEARELAAALMDAAGDVEPSTINLTESPVAGIEAIARARAAIARATGETPQ